MKKNVHYALPLALLLVLFFTSGYAQSPDKKWGVELNVVWPFVPGVEIYTAKATRTCWTGARTSGDLTFGFLYRPGTKSDENAEIFREIGLNLGYRHYFYKKFHAELAVYPSWAQQEKNKADGRNYRGLALTTEFYTGYRFDIQRNKPVSWYLMPQVGLGYNVFDDLGPETERNAPFPALNLQAGIRF